MSYRSLDFITFVFLLLSGVSLAQPTIESIHMPVSGDTIRYTQATLSNNYDFSTTGANSTWDFSSNLEDIRQDLYEYKDIKNVSWTYAALLGFNLYGLKMFDTIGIAPLEFHDVYDFFENEPTQFTAVARAFTYQGIPVAAKYTDPDVVYQFPLEFGDVDSDEFRVALTIPSFAAFTQYGTRTNEVDGWGTVITPYGSDSCVRVKTTYTQTDSLLLDNLPFPINLTSTTVSYKWLSVSERIPVLEVSGSLINENFAPTTIRYRDTFDVNIVDPLLPIIDFSASEISPGIGDTVSLFQNTENAFTYTWDITPSTFEYINGTDETSDNPVVLFNSSGSYNVALTGSNFFESVTKTKKEYITVSTVDAVNPILIKGGIQIFPQPSSGTINVKIDSDELYNDLNIVDMLGNVIYRGGFEGDDHQITLDLKPGIYLIKVGNGNQLRTQIFSVR